MTAPLPEPLWFGPSSRPAFGWLHGASSTPVARVVLCPPIGYEAWCSYASWRALAERLAGHGALVLRLDYDGCGDSAGEARDPGRLEAWRASVAHATQALQARSPGPVALVGLRMGGTLALLEAAGAGAAQVVLWDPVVSGRRFVRELKLLGTTVTSEGAAPGSALLEVAGAVYDAANLAELGAIDLLKLECPGLRRALLIDRDDRPVCAALAASLERQGVQTRLVALAGTGAMLDVATEDALVPDAVISAICEELTFGRPPGSATSDGSDGGDAPAPGPRATFEWRAALLTEEPVRLGSQRLFGMLGGPAQGAPRDWVVLFINGGIEHHVGPGRAWVEFCRELNRRGAWTVRLDLDGIGESPLRGPPRRVQPYDAQFVTDVDEAVRALRARGFARVAVSGLCSGAWTAVQSGRSSADAVCAINPQLYWDYGEPVEALLKDTRVRRAEQRASEEEGRRNGFWSELDEAGVWPPAARWLEELAAREVPTLLAFAKGDDGIEYLRNRIGRRLDSLLARGALEVVEVDGIDHPMHRQAKRPEMLAAIAGFFDRLLARPRSPRS